MPAMTTTSAQALDSLLNLQQGDGGWAYGTTSSWTEPTCYSVLALRAVRGPAKSIARACQWLARRQRRDGGWSPGPAVEQSTHVTSLSILALSDLPEYENQTDRGVDWLLTQSGAESSIWARLARAAMGTSSGATRYVGWPWFPGAAAWVIPTSMAIFALSKQKPRADLESRINEAQSFLLSRRCPDYGWNHGGLFRAGETPASYPETTGIALLALHGLRGSEVGPSIRSAERHARDPRSSEGANWLRMGLLAHGNDCVTPSTKYRNWTVNQVALGIIAEVGKEGRNPFVEHV